jgi:phenylacetate-CoA ligase
MNWFDTPQSAIDALAWPPVFAAADAEVAARALQFSRSEWMSRDVIEAGQRRQLASIARHHVQHQPAFVARLAAAGLTAEDLGQPGGLQALGLLHRRTVQRDFAAQPAIPLPPGVGQLMRYSTSGSTGEPVLVWKTSRNHLDWQALTLRYYHWSEPDFSARLGVIKARAKQIGQFRDWGFPIARFHPTGPVEMVDVAQDVGDQLDKLRAFGVQTLMAYPSVIAALLAEGRRSNRPLDQLRRVRTLGETLSPELREHFTHHGLAVADCYSTEEFGYVSIECPHGTPHIMAETVIVEVLDEAGEPCRPGETGRVVITDLQNLVAPLIRYVTGDHAIAGDGDCPCGRGLPTLGRVLGRERNMIVLPDGARHWPLTGFAKYRDIAPVNQYQLIQHARDRIELRLVTERPLTPQEEDALRLHVISVVGFAAAIDFTYFPNRLPMGGNGKFEEFVNRVPSD